MKVIIKDSVYEMTRKQFDGVLGVARKSFESGIYAVEKENIAEMKNEPYEDENALKKAIKDYEDNGFKVYWK